jgi:hypoxanthine phosphoribosyltransferase
MNFCRELLKGDIMGEFIKRKITHGEFYEFCEELADKIRASGNKYKYIVGIPRGGSIVGVYLSHQLNIPFMEYKVFMDSQFSKEIPLIVDDISDTGITLDIMSSRWNTATIFWKQRSLTKPTYFHAEIPDNYWIVFPWELDSEIPNRDID